jgi:PKD repeat protein
VVLTVTDSCTPAHTQTANLAVNAYAPVTAKPSVNYQCGYAPLNVIFTGNASGGIGPYSYAWDFGDGTAGSTLQNPSHSYLAVGTYTAKLTVTDSLGSSGTASVPVTVTPVLSVSVQGTPATVGPAPLTVNVSSSVAGGTPPYTYDWNFADGSQDSHSPADQHTWATPGQYTVVLTVTDSCTPAHTQTANLAVNAYAPVTVTATANALCGTAPLNVCFSGTATGGLPPYSYSWNFGDNSPVVIGVAPCHIYSSAGNFSVTLSVTDSIGNESSTNIVVKVAQVQSLQAMASSDKAMGLAPLAVDFSATASGGDGNYTYDWNFGDGSPHGSTAVTQHLYQTPGSYTVTLTVTSLDVCGKSLTATDAHLTITVLSSPTIVLTSPTSGSSYGASVPFASIVYDDAPVVRVDYLINGNVVGSATAAPYAFTWYSSGLSGQYTASATVYDSLGRSASSATLSIRLSNPSLSGQIIQLQNPFRLKIFGSNFEPGAKVYLNEVAAPITTFKSPTVLVAKQGASLKALLPKGVPVIVTVKNPDGGLSGQATLVR